VTTGNVTYKCGVVAGCTVSADWGRATLTNFATGVSNRTADQLTYTAPEAGAIPRTAQDVLGTSIYDSGYSTFSNACIAAASSGRTLIVTGTWTALTTQTCAANIRAYLATGSTIKPANAQTITLTGGVDGPAVQLFDTSAGGSVVVESPGTKYPQWWGAKGDARYVYTASMVAGQKKLTITEDGFTAGDVGKLVYVMGVGPADTYADILRSTIAAYIDPNNVTLADAATTSLTGQFARWGTDNTAALQAAIAGYGSWFNAGDDSGSNNNLIFFPRGGYLMGDSLHLPNVGHSINRRYTFAGEGPGMSSFYQFDITKPIFDVEDLGLAGVQNTWKDIGFFGVPNYSFTNGAAIYCHLSIGVRFQNVWFNAFEYGLQMSPNGAGTGSQEVYIESPVFEYGTSLIKWDAGTDNAYLYIHGGEIATAAHNFTGGYAIDLNGVKVVLISDLKMNYGVGRGFRCIGCTGIDYHDVDHSGSVDGGANFGSQNIYLENSSGTLHDNHLSAVYTVAVEFAGGNTITGHDDTYNVPNNGAIKIQATATNNLLKLHDENIVATPASSIYGPSTALLPGSSITRISCPSGVTPCVNISGALPAGVYVSSDSLELTTPKVLTPNLTLAGQALTSIYGNGSTIPAAAGLFYFNRLRKTDASGNEVDSGVDGATATLSCSGGQAVKTITVSNGIVTAVTCGAP
jgi:hypothetical protein